MAKSQIKLHPKLARFLGNVEKRMELKDIIINPSFEVGYINTGSTMLNLLIGGSRLANGSFVCPGWPKGSISEIIGRESSGKTTVALTAMAQALAIGGCGLYVDLECAVKDHYAMKLGVDFRSPELGGDGKAVRASPHTFEETEAIVTAAALQGIDIIVIDSVAGLVSRRDIHRDPSNPKEKQGIAEVPRLMSAWMPKLQQIIARTKTCVIFTNQTRDKIGSVGYTEESTKSTTGGNALKFWASIRMWLKPKMATKAKLFNPLLNKHEDVQIATDIECRMYKNKIDARQGHSGLITIRYGVGIDELRTLMNVAEAYNIVNTSGKKKKDKDKDDKDDKDKKNSEKSIEYSFKSSSTGKLISAKGIERFRISLVKEPDVFEDFKSICTERILQGFRQIDDEELANLVEGAEFKSMDDDNDVYLDGDLPDEIEADANELAELDDSVGVASVTVDI